MCLGWLGEWVGCPPQAESLNHDEGEGAASRALVQINNGDAIYASPYDLPNLLNWQHPR